MKTMKAFSYLISITVFIVTTLYYLMPKTFNTDDSDLIFGSLVCIVNFLIYLDFEINDKKDNKSC